MPILRSARVLAWGLLASLLSCAGPAFGDLESELARAGARILSDPGTFLFDNFHENTSNVTPIYMGRRFEISGNIFPSLFPFGELNAMGKVRAHREHGAWPQIDVMAGGWTCLPLLFLPSDVKRDFDPSFFGYHAGFIMSESLDPRMRLFVGYEFSQLRAGVNLQELKEDDTSGSTDEDWDFIPDTISAGKAEHYLVIGAELLRSIEKRLVSQIGYGLLSNRLVVRIMWESKRFDTGIVFYPEGYPLFFWPLLNTQWRF